MTTCWTPLHAESYPGGVGLLVRIEPDGQRPVVVVHGLACDQALNSKCSLKEGDRRAAPPGIMYTVDVLELTRVWSSFLSFEASILHWLAFLSLRSIVLRMLLMLSDC
jgi:hypothetical protein